MTTAKLVTAGVLSLFFTGCSTTQSVIDEKKPQIKMGGVAGLIVGGAKPEKDHSPVVPDANFIPYKRKPRGQVRFEVPIERNFKPSPKFLQALPVDDDSDPVARVIEMKHDPDRSARIKRLVR